MQDLRTVLVVEDNDLNRELLTDILSATEKYNIITAENGLEGFNMLLEYGNAISLVLLDIMMPVMDGYGFLNAVRENGRYTGIPIIVATAEYGDEIKALEMGASDFVTKPYNLPVVIKRVESMIRLKESAVILHKVERDAATGLYSREFFMEYISRRLSADEENEYDMVCIELESYRDIHSRYGDERCNAYLHRLAELLKTGTPPDSIIGRIDDELIAMLIRHVDADFHKSTIKDNLTTDLLTEMIPEVQLNCGVYMNIEKGLSAELICNNALVCIDDVRYKYGQHVAFFDDKVRDRLSRRQFISENMNAGITERQFKVYYQPKHNVDKDVTGGAEALVRWIHPQAGFMSPGEFIPIFEHNGFIYELDKYIIDTVCRDMRRWMDEGKKILPVSINVSQVDFDHSDLDEIIENIVDGYGIPHELIHLEITESASATDNLKKKKLVSSFRSKGFEVELDDFGAGYSSLNTLGELPISVMKVDMALVRNMFEPKYKAILEGAMFTAARLKIKVVTEGVETIEQVEGLKDMCAGRVDLYIQGYYYSKPLPVDQFEDYVSRN